MYRKFYGLQDKPFTLSPDVKFFFTGDSHKKALDLLSSGTTKDCSLFVLTGSIGAGKTLVLKSLVSRLGPEFEVIQVCYPTKSSTDLLQMILLNMDVKSLVSDPETLRKRLKDHLFKIYRKNRLPFLVIDEGQNLKEDALEEIGKLLTLQQEGKPFVKVLLAGYPQLLKKLYPIHSEKVHGKINACHLGALSSNEVRDYIHHRLAVAGTSDLTIFPDDLIAQISRLSGGIPRIINTICDLLLLQGCSEKKKTLDPLMLERIKDKLPARATAQIPRQGESTGAAAGKKSALSRPYKPKKPSGHNSMIEKVFDKLSRTESTEPGGGAQPVLPPPERPSPVLKKSKSDGREKSIPSAASLKIKERSEKDNREDREFKKPLSLKVLILEDNTRMRVHLEDRLRDYEYNVVIAGSVKQLFDILEQTAEDELPIIVSDFHFFFSLGRHEKSAAKNALDRLQTNYGYLPLIITSTLPLTSVRSQILRKGASFLLKKPDLSRTALSEGLTQFDMFFDELHSYLANIYSQLNEFCQRVLKFAR